MPLSNFAKIRADEIARARIRERLEEKSGRESKLLAFANTNFGLFLLSTIFISVFSWSFNTWVTHAHDVKEIHQTRQKLGLEIMNRLRYIDELNEPFEYNEYHTIQSAIDGFTVGANQNPSWIPHYSAVFTEYQNRSLMSLLWELESTSSDTEKQQLNGAQKPVMMLHRYFMRLIYREVPAPHTLEGKSETLQLSDSDIAKLNVSIIQPLAFLRNPAYYGSE